MSFSSGRVAAAVLAGFLAACASAPPPPPPPPSTPPPIPFTPPPQQPQCYDETYYVGQYSTARQYETSYFSTHDESEGAKALDLFASYLECAPTGAYAIAAHLRKARLHCAMGNLNLGKEQLRALAAHPQAGGSEVIDAKYVFDFCEGIVDFRGNRRGDVPPR
ncbi:MAG TPA: hypothetical protein VGJ82_05400 [Thermoanaerobaculia bacterium]|jgi:hypothetical protein